MPLITCGTLRVTLQVVTATLARASDIRDSGLRFEEMLVINPGQFQARPRIRRASQPCFNSYELSRKQAQRFLDGMTNSSRADCIHMKTQLSPCPPTAYDIELTICGTPDNRKFLVEFKLTSDIDGDCIRADTPKRKSPFYPARRWDYLIIMTRVSHQARFHCVGRWQANLDFYTTRRLLPKQSFGERPTRTLCESPEELLRERYMRSPTELLYDLPR